MFQKLEMEKSIGTPSPSVQICGTGQLYEKQFEEPKRNKQ